MAEPAAKLWTLDEFLAYDDGKGTRHELFHGEIVAMAPATRAHAVLSARLARLLGNALQPPCEVAAQAGIIPLNRADTWYEADLAITCTPGSPRDQFIGEPVVVVEILSPSTAVIDRGRKLQDYKEIASVEDILLVSSTERRIEHWRRGDEGWLGRDLSGAGEVRLQAFGITVHLAQLYEGALPAGNAA